jgi:hypothetical protein
MNLKPFKNLFFCAALATAILVAPAYLWGQEPEQEAAQEKPTQEPAPDCLELPPSNTPAVELEIKQVDHIPQLATEAAQNDAQEAAKPTQEATLAQETSQQSTKELSEIETDTQEDSEEALASATKPIPTPFFEPQTNTSLALLDSRLKSITEFYLFNHHSSELALAINLGLNRDAFIRRQNFKVVENARQAPYMSMATLAIFPEIIKIAEKLRAKAIQRSADILAANVSNDGQLSEGTLETLGQAFGRIDAMVAELWRVGEFNRASIGEWRRLDGACFVGDSPADFLKECNRELGDGVWFQNERFEALLSQYEQHRDFCGARLEYLDGLAGRMSNVRLAVGLSELQKSVGSFLGVFENYQLAYSAMLERVRGLGQTRRDGLEGIIDGFVLKRANVEADLYRFPERFRVYDVKQVRVEPEQVGAAVLAHLRELRRSALLREALMSDEAFAAEVEEFDQWAELFAEAVAPYLQSIEWPISSDIPPSLFPTEADPENDSEDESDTED